MPTQRSHSAVLSSLPIRLLKKRLDYLATYLFLIGGGSVLVFALKMVIHRQRPVSETPLIHVGGWSFPSGHALMSVVFYGFITYLLFRRTESWRLRLFVIMAAGFIIFLVGLSRIYLQVHYLSDVLAGYMGGLFWVSICITGLEIYRKRR